MHSSVLEPILLSGPGDAYSSESTLIVHLVTLMWNKNYISAYVPDYLTIY